MVASRRHWAELTLRRAGTGPLKVLHRNFRPFLERRGMLASSWSPHLRHSLHALTPTVYLPSPLLRPTRWVLFRHTYHTPAPTDDIAAN